MLAELAWAAGRPTSSYQSDQTVNAIMPQSPSHRLVDCQVSVFWHALTKTEHGYIGVYIQKKGSNKVLMLGQNPDQRVPIIMII